MTDICRTEGRMLGYATELQPATLALDALADALRQHEAPPDALCLKFEFQSHLGGCCYRVDLEQPIDGGNDRWLGGWLYWGGAKEAAPVNASYALELAAVKEGGTRQDLRRSAGCVGDAWTEGCGYGASQLCKWSRLRRAVLDGCSLQMTVVVLPPSEPATLDTTLNVPSSPNGTLAAIGTMLDGPFTGAALTAGGRTFRAHRVVLAAASPVFLSMLDGTMREAREAAVELVEADAGAVELLLRHVYGGAIDVPLSLALQLYALADQYQLASGLQQRLRLGLMALQLGPEALCEVAPSARTLCRAAYSHNIKDQAAAALSQLSPLPTFAGWPADAVVEVMEGADPLPAFIAAVAWMEAQPQPVEQQHLWPQLLDAVAWAKASSGDLRAML
ncbi:hypothetical protein Rsub_01527 [Raphidocelis subcapitata]|uniref:BTB domain-containing protein n=1 Tax=Raphidocelis subcapitata TaxID=307507 RepID=A0A2V0NN91_9CHLO|nr:hypothetical protein Rsub_01527 [Raphidocelis subcapitata]|eukprot:GBF89028.1 hypothetical protein Rsub_01527 [Raphidocelis subcapitata]